MVNYLLQHTLRGLCSDSQWVYAVFWRILPRNYPPPKWDTEGGIMDRSKGNKRNWILVWEDGYCDFSTCARAATSLSNRCSTTVSGEGADEMMTESFQPELFFKMSHEVYNYGEGLMGKVAADNSHKWVYKEPPENDMNFLSSWHGSLDPHPRTWEAQFKSGIQTIAVVAVREGLIQLGSLHKIVEDLNFVIFLQRKFNYLQSIPGVFAIHPPLSFDLRRSKMASSSSQENPSCDGFNNHGDHHDKICPSPTKDLNHPHSHTQLAGMKRPPDQFIDMSKQNTVPALYGSCLSPNKAMNAGWNTRQASINNNNTIVLPLMQPSMSSLQALLSKLPSVTSAEQTSSHFPASLEAVKGVSSLNARNPVTNPLESSEASSFQKSCLTLNSTAHMSTSPSGHADFADSKLHVRHQEATGSNSSSHHGGLCPNFLDSCSNPLQLHETHGDLETSDDAYHSLLNQIIS